MNSKEEKDLNISGVVIEALPNALFRVKLEDAGKSEILAYLSGKMRYTVEFIYNAST